MKGFFDKLLKGGDNKDDNNNNNNPPKITPNKKQFHGGGQSLGGSKPGKVIPVAFAQPGPLGMKVEKRPNSQGTAIVAMVVPDGQANQAGLQRGDILCFAGSNGQEEIMYDQFIAMAASDIRPLVIDVRRIETKAAAAAANNNSTSTNSNNNSNSLTRPNSNATSKSAEDFARRQAVIAAAEARERAHKSKLKPIPKTDKSSSQYPELLTTAEKRRLEKEREERAAALQQLSREPQSEETRRAMQMAKAEEAALAAQLGYNPYETARSTAGQARVATVAVTHGAIQSGTNNSSNTTQPSSNNRTSSSSSSSGPSIPTVRPPTSAFTATDDDDIHNDEQAKNAFEAYTTMITTNNNNGDTNAIKTSLGIMRKLIVNAITKGQEATEEAAKFRRVRLANPKIQESIAQVPGALELMLAVGFQLVDEGNDMFLVYPWNANNDDDEPTTTPKWLTSTLLPHMEDYEKSPTTTTAV